MLLQRKIERKRLSMKNVYEVFQLKTFLLQNSYHHSLTTQEYITYGYIPFYILYYILMALHIQFANTALGLGRRYRRLNNALTKAFPIGTWVCITSNLELWIFIYCQFKISSISRKVQKRLRTHNTSAFNKAKGNVTIDTK